MTLYAAVLFLHFVGVAALFAAFGIEWTANTLLRRAASAEEVKTWLRLAKVAPPISGPALGLLLLTGGYLASLIGAMKQGWIPASLIGVAVVFLLGIVVNVPQMRKIRLALGSAQGSLGADALLALRSSALVISVRLRAFLALAIVFLMTAKPAFAASLIVLAIGGMVGFVAGFAAGRRST